MIQAENRSGQCCQFQRNNVSLHQSTKGYHQFGASHPGRIPVRFLLCIQQAQCRRDQRQKRQGRIFPHRRTPVNIINVVGCQHVQNTAYQRGFVMPEHLAETEKGDSRRKSLHRNGIGTVCPLYAHSQQAQHCREIQKQFAVKQRRRIPVAVLGLGIDTHRELPFPQGLGDSFNAGKMEPPVGTLSTTAIHEQRHTGQHRNGSQQPQTAAKVRVPQRSGAAWHQKDQCQVHQRKYHKPPQYTGPCIGHILADFHVADGKNAAIVIRHQTDGIAGIVYIEYHRILLSLYIDPSPFAADRHFFLGRKIHAGAPFDFFFGTARLIPVIQCNAVVPGRQRHSRCLQNRLTVGHFGNAAPPVGIIFNAGCLGNHFPLIGCEGIRYRRFCRRPKGPQHHQKFKKKQNQNRRTAAKGSDRLTHADVSPVFLHKKVHNVILYRIPAPRARASPFVRPNQTKAAALFSAAAFE